MSNNKERDEQEIEELKESVDRYRARVHEANANEYFYSKTNRNQGEEIEYYKKSHEIMWAYLDKISRNFSPRESAAQASRNLASNAMIEVKRLLDRDGSDE